MVFYSCVKIPVLVPSEPGRLSRERAGRLEFPFFIRQRAASVFRHCCNRVVCPFGRFEQSRVIKGLWALGGDYRHCRIVFDGAPSPLWTKSNKGASSGEAC